MIAVADLAIVIAEKERWPSYLKESPKVLLWDIQDPARMTADLAEDVYRQVRSKVEELVAEIG